MTVRFECPKLVRMDGFSLWSVGFRPPNPDLANNETFYGIFFCNSYSHIFRLFMLEDWIEHIDEGDVPARLLFCFVIVGR